MPQSAVKKELLDRMDFAKEFDDLLGKGKGQVRRCWNAQAHSNNDVNPSLSFNAGHGGWKCHTCGEKGDIFSLYMKVNKVQFADAIKHYLEKYNLWHKHTDFNKSAKNRAKFVEDMGVRAEVSDNVCNWFLQESAQKLDFMYRRYGLDKDTLVEYNVGYSRKDARIWIPVFANTHICLANHSERKSMTRIANIVNVRKHDVFRAKCQWYNKVTRAIQRQRPPDIKFWDIAEQTTGDWRPIWSEESGKVLSVRGHGSPYIYPADQLLENHMVYLVGGELKALLLIKLGLPAVTFTCGEGGFSKEWLPYFIGKHVRVIFDADPGSEVTDIMELSKSEQKFAFEHGIKGLTFAERATLKIGQILANTGAYTEVAFWQDEIKKVLPDKGDITDFLRLAGWNPKAIDVLDWIKVEREEDAEAEMAERTSALGEEIPTESEMEQINFYDLVDPNRLNTWVKFNGLVSGRGDSPYVVPKKVCVTCKVGEQNMMPKCGKCSLPGMGFRFDIEYPIAAQVEMVGLSIEQTEKTIAKELGIPKSCQDPDFDVTPAAIELSVCTPTVELEENDFDVGSGHYEYAHRNVYFLNDNRIKLEENKGYKISGKIISDPKKGIFTFAAVNWSPLDNDIFSFNKTQTMDDKLRSAVRSSRDLEESRSLLMEDFRDHIVKQIYGQQGMLQAIVLSWFLPFSFRLGHHIQERICPSIMILGDTNVGKSTATNKIIQHFGAGRPYSANADATFAGLVGGNISTNYRMSFSWGALPTSHRALVALDEYNKLSIETIGKLTNVLSSGVAERVTANGIKKTRAWVRLLLLCNPRGERRLTTYSNPLDAALLVASTVQDLGRVEYVHVQHQLSKGKLSNLIIKHMEPMVDHKYTKEVARYHLQWAWSRTPEEIVFEDPTFVFKRSMDLSDKYGGHTLFLPAQARFKLARVAAGFATQHYSTDEGGCNVVVRKEHVEMASRFFEKLYDKMINPAEMGVGGILHPDLVKIFDRITRYRNLRFLANSATWSKQDLEDALGIGITKDFIDVAQYNLGMITRKGKFYEAKYDSFQDLIDEYLNNREKSELYSGSGE